MSNENRPRTYAVALVAGHGGTLLPTACALRPWLPAPADPHPEGHRITLPGPLSIRPSSQQLITAPEMDKSTGALHPLFRWPLDAPSPEITFAEAFDEQGQPTWALAAALLDALNLTQDDADAVIRAWGGSGLSGSPLALTNALALNPWRLCAQAPALGLGWRECESAAFALGGDPSDPARGDAAALGALAFAAEEGSNCITPDAIESWTRANAGNPAPLRFSPRFVRIGSLARQAVDPKHAHRAQSTADRLNALNETAPHQCNADIKPPGGITLDPSQEAAVRTLLKCRAGILSGGPGTGKTTTLRCLVDSLEALAPNIRLAAFSGQAADRIRQSTGRAASTIHALIGKTSDDQPAKHGPGNPLALDALVIDEASMVPDSLFNEVLLALPEKARLILCGDPHQIPPIGEGAPFIDLLATEALPSATLTRTHRVNKGSGLLSAFGALRDGRLPASGSKDFHIIDAKSWRPDETAQRIVRLAAHDVPQSNPDLAGGVQILTPLNKGAMGVHNLNAAMQAAVNPQGKPVTQGVGTKPGLRIGDPVTFLRNDSRLAVRNGTRGIIIGEGDLGSVRVQVEDGRKLPLDVPPDKLPSVQLAYAISIHKSQGSEYPAVVIAAHSRLADRSMIYTAATRAKETVYLVGDPEWIANALRRSTTRATLFRSALSAYLGAPGHHDDPKAIHAVDEEADQAFAPTAIEPLDAAPLPTPQTKSPKPHDSKGDSKPAEPEIPPHNVDFGFGGVPPLADDEEAIQPNRENRPEPAQATGNGEASTPAQCPAQYDFGFGGVPPLAPEDDDRDLGP